MTTFALAFRKIGAIVAPSAETPRLSARNMAGWSSAAATANMPASAPASASRKAIGTDLKLSRGARALSGSGTENAS